MSIYFPGNGCGSIPPPVCKDCIVKERGRVRGFWLQKTTYSFADITNPAEWCAAQAAGDVYVFPYSSGSVDQTELTSDGYGNVPTTLDSYEYNLNLHDPNYAANIPFYNAIKNSYEFKVGYKTETLFHLSSVGAMVFPKAPVSADIKAKIDINLVIKFIQDDLIVPTAGPAGIFDACADCA